MEDPLYPSPAVNPMSASTYFTGKFKPFLKRRTSSTWQQATKCLFRLMPQLHCALVERNEDVWHIILIFNGAGYNNYFNWPVHSIPIIFFIFPITYLICTLFWKKTG